MAGDSRCGSPGGGSGVAPRPEQGAAAAAAAAAAEERPLLGSGASATNEGRGGQSTGDEARHGFGDWGASLASRPAGEPGSAAAELEAGGVDLAVLAELPPSIQREVRAQLKAQQMTSHLGKRPAAGRGGKGGGGGGGGGQGRGAKRHKGGEGGGGRGGRGIGAFFGKPS